MTTFPGLSTSELADMLDVKFTFHTRVEAFSRDQGYVFSAVPKNSFRRSEYTVYIGGNSPASNVADIRNDHVVVSYRHLRTSFDILVYNTKLSDKPRHAAKSFFTDMENSPDLYAYTNKRWSEVEHVVFMDLEDFADEKGCVDVMDSRFQETVLDLLRKKRIIF